VEGPRLRELRSLLESGKTVAVVTDAGMPGISDPGIELVRAARTAGAAIDVLPGPSALLGALVLSGFDIARFRFDGFPPRKSGERRAYLQSLRNERAAVVWYEAPTRVRALLADVIRAFPERRVFALREYTKKFEQHLLGTAEDVLRRLDEPRGEFTIVLEGGAEETAQAITPHIAQAMALLLEAGLPLRSAVEALRLASPAPRNALYALAQQHTAGQTVSGRALARRTRT
jgi:16S rRNA (cytidine1402-2'-O)-methyltransferase